MAELEDRVEELVRVKPSEIDANPRNWRRHGYEQSRFLEGVLEQVGIADALLGYRSERNDGKITLIDGHLRKEIYDENQEVPVILLDVTDEEADMLLATLDPLAGMADMDDELLDDLVMDSIQNTDEVAARDLLVSVGREAKSSMLEEDEEDTRIMEDGVGGPPEMELQPMEHYDYIVLLFRDVYDWQQALDVLGIQREGFTVTESDRKIGLGRLVDGREVISLVQKAKKMEGEDE